MTEAQLGYVAAALDGEGTISISRSKGKRNYEYMLNVVVVNTDIRMIEWLKLTTKIGNISIDDGKRSLNWKTKFIWRLRHYEIEALLQAVLPYLVIKRDQAMLMLEFIPLLGSFGQRPSLDTHIMREIIYEEMRKFNKRGI